MDPFAFLSMFAIVLLAAFICLAPWALRRQARRLRQQASLQAINASPAPAVICQSGLVVHANPAIGRLFPETVAQLIGVELRDIVPEEADFQALMASFDADQKSSNQRIAGQEIILASRGDVPCWVEFRTTALTYQGAPAHLLTFIDITDRKKLAVAGKFKHNEKFLQGILRAFDYTDDGVTISGPGRKIIFANARAAEIAGYDRMEDLIGRRWPDVPNAKLWDTGIFSPLEPENQALLTTQGYFRNETRVKFDSVEKVINISIASLPNGGFISIIRDFTRERRQSQETEILQAQLERSRRLETIGQLAGGIAHDFNNLMGAILGFAWFIQQDNDPASQTHGFANRITTAGGRARELVAQIMSFSQHSAHSESLVSLAALADEAYQLLRPTLPASTNLRIGERCNTSMISGDPAQISQAIVNLCLNAHKSLNGGVGEVVLATGTIDPFETGLALQFSPSDGAGIEPLSLAEGPVTLEKRITEDAGWIIVTIGRLLPDLAYVELTVHDTGIGMARPVAQELFQPFFTKTSDGAGTGLGLSIVHNVVMAHGGAIHLRTREGHGSEFRLLFPASSAEVPTQQAESPPPDVSGNGQILIIDDDIDFGDMLSIALERLGYETGICSDPVAGLESFNEAPDFWQVVIVDQTMPNLKGIDVIRKIRETSTKVKIILCSGYGGGLSKTAAHAAGADLYLQKPVDLRQLSFDIAALLGRSLSPDEAQVFNRQGPPQA